MSAILATEIVQSAFDRARNAVLNSSDRLNETVFVGIQCSNVAKDQRISFTNDSWCGEVRIWMVGLNYTE
jgi:hypothetical protein